MSRYVMHKKEESPMKTYTIKINDGVNFITNSQERAQQRINELKQLHFSPTVEVSQ